MPESWCMMDDLDLSKIFLIASVWVIVIGLIWFIDICDRMYEKDT